jgi:NADH:ubiquinone oxidoreductase subunit E
MGYVDEEAMKKIARYFDMLETEIFSAASFYDDIHIKKQPDFVVKVCDGTNCVSKRSEDTIQQVEAYFHQRAGDDNNPKIKIERMSCQGLCLVGPILKINEVVYEKVRPEDVDDILKNYFG